MIKRLPIIPTLVVLAAVAFIIWLGVWNLQRATLHQAQLDAYRLAARLPPMAFPTGPAADENLSFYRYATGNCLRVVNWRTSVGENQNEEPGFVVIADCATGSEGPGMSVELGWSKNPNARPSWAGGLVSERCHRSGSHQPDAIGHREAGERTGSHRCPCGQRSNHSRPQSWIRRNLVRAGCGRPGYLCLCVAQADARSEVSGEQHVLRNGLIVAADPLPGAESMAVGVYARVGSRSEPDQLGGLAHLVEHMVFKGAGGRDTRALAEAVEDVGGSLNAWTARDQTVFHGRALGRDLALVTELLADLIRAPHFDEEHLEREKLVILSELGETIDLPDDLVHDHLFEAAFDGQPLGRSVLGTEASVRAASRQDCFEWLRGQFTPSRLVLSASGKVDPEQLLVLAEGLFGDLETRREPDIAPARFTGGTRSDRRRFEQAHWCLAFEGLRSIDDMMPALALFVQALGGGTSSRLFQEMREERGLAYSIYAWSQAFADVGMVGIGCAAEQARAAESVQLARELLEQTAIGLTGVELDRARAQFEANVLMTLETPQGRADHMARSIEVFGRVVALEELLGQIRSVSVEDARAVGQALLTGPIAVASVGAQLALAA